MLILSLINAGNMWEYVLFNRSSCTIPIYTIIYQPEGHGKSELPAAFARQTEKENVEMNHLFLLTANAVPEEADCVVIYTPERDTSSAG